jgi:hypothetical protein
MPGYLRQSTAGQARAIGPFLDRTDGVTAETGLTINAGDVKLIIGGGASQDKNSGGGTHRANGVYGFTFNATDTATVGEMEVSIDVAGALPVFDKFFILEEAVYDALFAASSPGYVANAPVNVAQFGGSNLTAASGIPEVKVASLAAASITAAAIATDAIDADALAANAVDEILDDTIGDGTLTVRQALRICVAALSGKLSGAGTTTVTIRNAADSADVVVATVDANGNRSATTITP